MCASDFWEMANTLVISKLTNHKYLSSQLIIRKTYENGRK